MATTLPSPRLTSPFSSSSLKTLTFIPKPFISFTTRATTDSESTSDPEPAKSESSSDDDDFESRLSLLKRRSVTGKKAENRKARKGGSSARSSSSVFLPPVPLKEPVSGGLKVDFGFSPYSERLNGRIAALGLTALLLVELATGKSVLTFHSPSIVLIQIYFVAAVTAIYIKFEKEKISIWPNSSQKD